MMRPHTWHKSLVLSGLLFGLISFSACENDMRDIDRIASIPEEEAVDISSNVAVTYSDSAKVKAVMTAPEMRVYHDSTDNSEFKKGVEIIFYDENLRETQRIKSNYALLRQSEQLTEFRDNVVVTKADGSVIKTEELFYDEKNQRYYNTVPIIFFFSDERGNQAATSFSADANFTRIDMVSPTGYYISRDNSLFPSTGF
ncbi:LPS export ABC transporter periplasmic protein LptC [Sphingobacterium sp. lm-10]|uniref:LPS export ABC transporter periplasmic protein LptC n=1 Tax=Sphingobacterium sp. lm-10 TaxID=2944904 RepID=UPI0020205F75|nr:LPS export ABC transporter periplasmic protein LptC [Sphingobacterium sp. lm-10]MCL7989392.1 LPS export ABC transporter periplasmic protein LptC [Sphingobacterium sp. lm-10]